MSNYISVYLRPDNIEVYVIFIDNRGGKKNHPGGTKEYSKDYYYVDMGGGPMGMTDFNKYVKNNNLKKK